jgi:thiamine-monophosphate kinase
MSVSSYLVPLSGTKYELTGLGEGQWIAMGEFELLARVREQLPESGPRVRLGSGDDAAISVPGGATATSVDALVEGVHFRRDQASLAQIGHKALAAALSDLAAMGAEPGEAYVVLGVPTDLNEAGCLELLDGMASLAAATGTTLAGGDVSRSRELILAVTVVGHAAEAEALVTRGGARPGDTLVLTGEVGGAAAGHLLLDRPDLARGLSGETADALRGRQLEPLPRLRAGSAFAAAGATAMIDLSDGLGGDARHLAESSRVGLRIDAEALPLAAGLTEIAKLAERDPLTLATSGGEDYELLATLPAAQVEMARQALREADGTTLTAIGEVGAGSGVEIRLPGGGLLEPSGFDQLA